MSTTVNYEKPVPTAPMVYGTVYPTGQPEPPQYGFQQPAHPQYSQPYPPMPQTVYISSPQTTQPVPNNQPIVIAVGGCPSCRVGILEDEYTCCGILCAICFFPLGILCCLAMKEKRCTNCKASF